MGTRRTPLHDKPEPFFTVLAVKHGFKSTRCEREIITSAGGRWFDAGNDVAAALAMLETTDALLHRRIDIDREMIQRLKNCKMIVRYAVGTDNVDIEAATERGIYVVNVPDYCIEEVSDHALGMLLAGVRHLVDSANLLKTDWPDFLDPVAYPYRRMRGRTLGVLGVGQIGSAVLRKVHCWGLNLLACDPYVDTSKYLDCEFVSFSELCRRSHFITLHAPLTEETKHIVNSTTLNLMQPGTILVNTARGGLIDTPALLAALESTVAFAALDVFEDEPLPFIHPLRSHSRVILSNHTAWRSDEAQLECQLHAAEEVVRVCAKGGLPRSLANPSLIFNSGRINEWTPAPSMLWQLKKAGLQLPSDDPTPPPTPPPTDPTLIPPTPPTPYPSPRPSDADPSDADPGTNGC